MRNFVPAATVSRNAGDTKAYCDLYGRAFSIRILKRSLYSPAILNMCVLKNYFYTLALGVNPLFAEINLTGDVSLM